MRGTPIGSAISSFAALPLGFRPRGSFSATSAEITSHALLAFSTTRLPAANVRRRSCHRVCSGDLLVSCAPMMTPQHVAGVLSRSRTENGGASQPPEGGPIMLRVAACGGDEADAFHAAVGVVNLGAPRIDHRLRKRPRQVADVIASRVDELGLWSHNAAS